MVVFFWFYWAAACVGVRSDHFGYQKGLRSLQRHP